MKYAHSDDLISASKDIHGLDETLPFEIELGLEGRQQNLECQEIYRLLPGRRITLKAVLDGVTVVVKFYLGAGQKRYWSRELSGVNILSTSALPTPRLLHYESDATSELSYLVFEYIPPAPSSSYPEVQQRVLELAPVLALMHNEGIIQNDLHLNNFLFGEKGIFLIDGDAIRKHGLVSAKMALENLAVLLAQLNYSDVATSRLCLAAYRSLSQSLGQSLEEKPVVIDLSAFHQRVVQLRLKRLDKLLEKSQRNCTAYYSTWDMWHFFVCARSSYNADMQTLMADLDGWVERGECLKDGNTCTVSKVCINDHIYVIKRYNIKSVWHGLGRGFRTTRARVSWLNSQILGFYEIPTAQVHALYEERKGPLRGRAFLIMEYLDGALLSTQKQPLTVENRTAVFSVFHKLFKSGLVHGDTKSSNFIVLKATQNRSKTALAVIDLDALRHFAAGAKTRSDKIFRKAFKKDIQRFLRNFDADPELAAGLSGDALSVTPTDCSV